MPLDFRVSLANAGKMPAPLELEGKMPTLLEAAWMPPTSSSPDGQVVGHHHSTEVRDSDPIQGSSEAEQNLTNSWASRAKDRDCRCA